MPDAQLSPAEAEITAPGGDLRGAIWAPSSVGVPTAVVLVDGAGDGTADGWGFWPEELARAGTTVLAHDKPGCGSSPGDWRGQTLEQRARESLRAIDRLRRQPGVADGPVGLMGFSQGAWVAWLAAQLEPAAVDFVITVSGPGVGPAVQERSRIRRQLIAEGVTGADVAEAMAWVDRRTDLLLSGADVADVLTEQAGWRERPWFSTATEPFDDPVMLRFLAGILPFRPAEAIAALPCPLLAMFGGADPLLPVPESVTALLTRLPDPAVHGHGLAVFPAADHGLFVEGPRPGVLRRDQLAPGVLGMIIGFIRSAARPAGPPTA